MVCLSAPAVERRLSNSGVVKSDPYTTLAHALRSRVSSVKRTDVARHKLLVITPSRGRPGELARLIAAIRDTRTATTQIAVGLDDNDPSLSRYLDGPKGADVEYVVGNRKSLAGWTNAIALGHLPHGFTHYASLGDDHVPRTRGWDTALMAAADPGISYGDDLAMHENLATAPVISTVIVRALGWMCQPRMAHYCVDNVWTDLGRVAGCLKYCPDVVVEHLHYSSGKAQMDATYTETGVFYPGMPDHSQYLEWVARERGDDAATIRSVMP